MKKLFSVLLSAVLLLGLFGCGKKVEYTKHCTVTVDAREVMLSSTMVAKEAVDKLGGKLPDLEKLSVGFAEGETVQQVVLRTLQEQKLQYEQDSSGFLCAIGSLYNGDAGELSGWLYTVNGEQPMVASSDYAVQEGDEIRFFYTINFLTHQMQ